jgi:arylsulfatase A-like enzyme
MTSMNNWLNKSLVTCCLATGYGLIITSCSSESKSIIRNNAPNILIILTDDQGWGDLSMNGNPNIQTPHVDALGKNGLTFDRFFAAPVCSPSRAEILTGRYALRGGVFSTSTGGERLNLDEKTMADYFKEAGYATATYGKWHSGMQPPYHPNSRGFDDFYGFCSGHWGDYIDPMMEHNGKIVQGEGYMSDDLTNHTIRFIEQNKNNPFLILLSFNTPHSPMQMPDELWNTVKDRQLDSLYTGPHHEDETFTRAAIAMCENIDWNMGRIMQKLKDLDIEENTLVIFTSDNGPNSWRWNGGMKGRKGSTDEGGVRVPMVMQWKGTLQPGKVINEIAYFPDLLPTVAELAQINFNPPKPLDGKSIFPLMIQDSPDWPDRMLISHWDGNTTVRNQKFRLDHENYLYDMVNDPGQTTDVSEVFPEIASELIQAKEQYHQELVATFPATDQRPFTVGHPEYGFTHLPARDAIAKGNIQRSNRWPNCSFYTNWTQQDDYIYWDVEIIESGFFEAVIYYTLEPENTGTRMQLSFGGSMLDIGEFEAHDPPLEGMEYDRIKREESYVKDFKPLIAGSLYLEKGKGKLMLEVLNITGNKTIDFRQLILNRID